jgi:hypothetical protein
MSKEQPAVPYIILNFSIWKLSNYHTVALQHRNASKRCDPMRSITDDGIGVDPFFPMAGKASVESGQKKPAQWPAWNPIL